MRIVLILFLLINLTACPAQVRKGEQEPAYMAIAPGSELVLAKNITIPANQTSVYIQNGNIKTYSSRDQYYPNCKFELYTISDKPRVVKADTFVIKKIARETDYASIMTPMYAGPTFGAPGNPTAIIYSVTFSLNSKKQADVFRMRCEHWADPLAGTDLTLTEVRETLKPLFSMKVK